MPELDNITISSYLAHRLGLNKQENDAWQAIFSLLIAQLEAGHTLLETNTDRQALLAQLPNHVICSPNDAKNNHVSPLIADEHYIWLHRIWQAEYSIVKWLLAQLKKPPRMVSTNDIKPFLLGLKQKQADAVVQALTNTLTIINGGPGTGKTFTIAKLIQALLFLYPDAHIKLAAPTGKAANRMESTLQQSLPLDIIEQLPSAKTIHSLLGIMPGRGARYHQNSPLDVDVLIVDEASMLSLELMQQLLSALPEHAQVILLGDANQLAAVEPGAVLHDMTRSQILAPAVVTLSESNRFSKKSVVGQLANAVLAGENAAVLSILAQPNQVWQQGDIHNLEQAQALFDELFEGYQPYLDQLLTDNTNIDKIFAAFDQYCILCAGHAGNLGSDMINKMMRQRHLAHLSQQEAIDFYHGQPLMVLVNQPKLKLYNGDIGLCLIKNQQQPALYFPNHENPIAIDSINRQNIVDAYAFSIHKSQGSEFDKVAICLDTAQKRLMSRELLYTAITRAKSRVDFYANQALITQAVNTPTERLTGINVQLANIYQDD